MDTSINYDLAESLRTSRRVLFEKVASKPSEHLTVLSGFNSNLLIAFSWMCVDFLDKDSGIWTNYADLDDDEIDWISSMGHMNQLLNILWLKPLKEILHMEWEVQIWLSDFSLLMALENEEYQIKYFGNNKSKYIS